MISKFEGQYHFLSNFYPIGIVYNDLLWPSGEHLYQALKTIDQSAREEIRWSEHAGVAKKLGKAVVLRPNWEEIKDAVMETVVWKKFRQNADLRKWLLDTGEEELQEGNFWHDTTWGVDLKTGQGENRLGKILMATRAKLRGMKFECGFCSGKGWVRCVKPYSKPIEYLYSECACETGDI